MGVERHPNGRVKQPRTSLVSEAAIYVMEGGPFTKIGFSQQPALRARRLQNSGPHEVTIAWIAYGAPDEVLGLEKAVHKRLRGKEGHVRSEWYSLPVEQAVSIIMTVASELGCKIRAPEPLEPPSGRYQRQNARQSAIPLAGNKF